MRTVQARPVWTQVATWCGTAFVGPWSALQLARGLSPESGLVQSVAPVSFMAIFLGGTVLWIGLGFVTVVASGLARMARGRRPGPELARPTDILVPSGYRAFVVVGVLVGGGLGVVAGWASELPWRVVAGAWLAAGGGYGLLLWAAAHHGYLPFPELE